MKLNAELAKALKHAEVRNSLLAEGAEPAGGSPERFAAHIRAEKERLGKLIRDAKIRLE
jgi:tripartite-type tricarboxylate transporter receptor subunit TctC